MTTAITLYNYLPCDVPIIFSDKPTEQVVVKAGEYKTVNKTVNSDLQVTTPKAMNQDCQAVLSDMGSTPLVWYNLNNFNTESNGMLTSDYKKYVFGGKISGDNNTYGKTDSGCVNLSSVAFDADTRLWSIELVGYDDLKQTKCTDDASKFKLPEGTSGSTYSTGTSMWLWIAIVFAILVIVVIIVVAVVIWKKKKSKGDTNLQ